MSELLMDKTAEIENKRSKIFDIVFSVIAVLIIIFLIFVTNFWISISIVQQSSMENTLFEDDVLITDILAKPKRYDVVIFKRLESGKETVLVKRVIGMQGDTVFNDEDGNVYIEYADGIVEKLKEEYIKDGFPTIGYGSETTFRVEVGENEYFVLGDNRKVSVDSRCFGVVKKENLIGVVHPFWIKNKKTVTKIYSVFNRKK